MRRLSKINEARLERLERRLPPEPQPGPYDYALMTVEALDELREAIAADGTVDPATLSPGTLAELEGARRDR